ncbi:hypothetical protein J6590_039877 [Homalodisca vitripennis]|nr:hypothetical protein J6590_039877 [Homalodisca vitripennis]
MYVRWDEGMVRGGGGGGLCKLPVTLLANNAIKAPLAAIFVVTAASSPPTLNALRDRALHPEFIQWRHPHPLI